MDHSKSFYLNRDIAMDEEINRFREDMTSNQEVIIRGVINRILGLRLENNLLLELEDGIVLCKLFKKLIPNSDIREPNQSKKLSFIQKRDNISIFTNACRSIHIPDVLLITHSYFDSQNLDLLISGLFTFFIWVLNLDISDSSARVTMNTLFEGVDASDVSSCITVLAHRLCGEKFDQEKEADQQDVQEVDQQDIQQISHEEDNQQISPVEFNQEDVQEAYQQDLPIEEASIPEDEIMEEHAFPQNEAIEDDSYCEESPLDDQFISRRRAISGKWDTDTESDDRRLSKQEWMKRRGVPMICPLIDSEEYNNRVTQRVGEFIDHLTNSVDSRRAVFIPERTFIQAEPANENEVVFLSETREFYRNRRYEAANNSGRKRRNVDFGGVNVKDVKPRVFDNVQPVNRDIEYVERLGKPRVVAGAVVQPRFLEGISNGVVVSRIQVRSVDTHPFPRLSTTRHAAEVTEEPMHPQGLFARESDEMREEENVLEMLYDENGEIGVDVLESRLDEDIRNSFSLTVCNKHNTIFRQYPWNHQHEYAYHSESYLLDSECQQHRGYPTLSPQHFHELTDHQSRSLQQLQSKREESNLDQLPSLPKSLQDESR